MKNQFCVTSPQTSNFATFCHVRQNDRAPDLGNDDSHKLTVDHLHRVHKSGHHLWEYPKKPDLCEVDLLQVLGVVFVTKTTTDFRWRLYSNNVEDA